MSPSLVIPALLTRTSIEPKSSFILATTASVSAKSAAFPAYALHFTPRASISLRVASRPAAISSLSTRSVNAMLAPSWANFIATALPIPRAAPVMRAVFPVNNPIMCLFVYVICFIVSVTIPVKSSGTVLLEVSQCAIHKFGNLRFGGFFCHSMGNTTIDIRHFKSLDTIVGDVSYKIYVFYVKLACLLALCIYLTEQFHFCIIKVLTHLLHHPYITEKLST